MDLFKLHANYLRYLSLTLSALSLSAHCMDNKRPAHASGDEPPIKKTCCQQAPDPVETPPTPVETAFWNSSIVNHIASFLDTQSLGRFRQVNRLAHDFTQNLTIDHIAQACIQEHHDPIGKLLSIAQDHDFVHIFGQNIPVAELVGALVRAGAQLTRVGDYEENRIDSYDGMCICKTMDFSLADHSNVETFIKNHGITLNSDLDVRPWHNTPDNPTAEQVVAIAEEFPKDGIVIHVGDWQLTKEWVQQLVESGIADRIVSLKTKSGQSVDFPDGLECLEQLTNLRELFLPINGNCEEIDCFPPQLCNLKELRALILFLETERPVIIPSDIANLTKLQYFQIVAGEATINVPKQIGKLSSLRCFIFDADKLSIIPQEIENLTNLRTLHLLTPQGVGVTFEKQEALRNLKNLRYLIVGEFKPQLEPGWVDKLKKLKEVHLGSHISAPCSKFPSELTKICKNCLIRGAIDDQSMIAASLIGHVAAHIGNYNDSERDDDMEIFASDSGNLDSITSNDCQYMEALRSLYLQGVFSTKIENWISKLDALCIANNANHQFLTSKMHQLQEIGQCADKATLLLKEWQILQESLPAEIIYFSKEDLTGQELVDLKDSIEYFIDYLTAYKKTLKETIAFFGDYQPEEYDLIDEVINNFFRFKE